MTLFSRFPTTVSIDPIFHLLDNSDMQRIFDVDPFSPAASALSSTTTTTTNNNNNNNNKPIARSFSPRFDARETADAYILEGELPGVKSRDLDLEFTDPHTLVVRGTSSRASYTSNQGKGQGQDQDQDSGIGETSSARNSHKAFVEDVPEDGTIADTGSADHAVATQKNKSKEVGRQTPSHWYWIAERSVGSFHRTFSFPARVDQDGVRASLREGILSIVVPKAVARGGRKIRVE